VKKSLSGPKKTKHPGAGQASLRESTPWGGHGFSHAANARQPPRLQPLRYESTDLFTAQDTVDPSQKLLAQDFETAIQQRYCIPASMPERCAQSRYVWSPRNAGTPENFRSEGCTGPLNARLSTNSKIVGLHAFAPAQTRIGNDPSLSLDFRGMLL
jgi:hypothetical protein